MGINDQKLALSFNVGEPNNNAKPGLPVVFKAREVMAKCDDLACAIDRFSRFLEKEEEKEKEKNYGELGANLIIVDFKNSTMARIQICSDGVTVTYGHEFYPADITYGAVTNHFEGYCSLPAPQRFRPFAWLSGMFRGNRKDSSHQRYERLMELLTTEGIKYDMGTCWWILTDSNGKLPNNRTICRKGFPVSTTASHVLTERFCYYSLGLPSKYLARYGKLLFIDLDDGLSRAVMPSITGTVKKSSGDESVVVPSIPIDLFSLQEKNTKPPKKEADLTTYTSPEGTFVFNNLVVGKYKVACGGKKPLFPSVDIDYNGENAVNLDFDVKNNDEKKVDAGD